MCQNRMCVCSCMKFVLGSGFFAKSHWSLTLAYAKLAKVHGDVLSWSLLAPFLRSLLCQLLTFMKTCKINSIVFFSM